MVGATHVPGPQQPKRPRVICAWCKALLHPGPGPDSHGICQLCIEGNFSIALSGVHKEQHD